MPADEWMGKQNTVYGYKGILFRNTKKGEFQKQTEKTSELRLTGAELDEHDWKEQTSSYKTRSTFAMCNMSNIVNTAVCYK